jgi:SsrA-binding protein
MSKKSGGRKSGNRPAVQNRKARRNYEIVERMEAGIALRGSEVKSLRAGQASLGEAYAELRGMEVWLVGAHIAEYTFAHAENHAPLRDRKLLLHRREIRRLIGKVREKGLTLVPLAIYFNDRGIAKVDLALARGRRTFDKRDEIRKRDQQRETLHRW